MSTPQEQRTYNSPLPLEGDICCIAFLSASATTVDLSSTDYLGPAVKDGHKYEFVSDQDMAFKSALTNTNAASVTAVSASGSPGGATQSHVLYAKVPRQFFIRTVKSVTGASSGLATFLSIRGVSANGTLRISRISQDDS